MSKKMFSLGAALTVLALLTSGCGGSDNPSGGGASAAAEPIAVGSVNTRSGPATFPEASQAAQAVFDAQNAQGGVNGRQIEYKSLDDKGDPATATSSAREIVGSDEAVAMVGGASLIECQINAKYYEQQKILSIPGIGVDTGCFNSPNIAPANVGPFNDLGLTLYWGSEIAKLDDICVLLEIAGSTRPAYQGGIDAWTAATGKKPKYVDDTVPYGASDYTPYIVKAKAAGCKAVAINGVEPDAIGQIKAANAQGWKDVKWLFLTSVYSENFAKAVNDASGGVYVPAEFYPFTDASSDINKEWRDLMTKSNIPLTSFSQGGFLAAKYFIQVASGIQGDITRESVTAALQEMQPITNPMVGTPYTFGKEPKHDQNKAGWPVKLESGTNKWASNSSDWVRIPS